jgi:hypothetical protein
VKRGWPIFLFGLALGAAAGSWGQRVAFHRAMQTNPDHHRQMVEKLSRELGLDEKQKAAVTAILDSRKAEVDKLRSDTFARLLAIRTSADAEIVKSLTPEQAAKLAAMHRAKPMRINWEAPAPAP